MSIDPLSREAIDAVDRRCMLDDVLAQPLQLGDALWRYESADIPRFDLPGGLIVCGMGGSAIGGDLAIAAIGDLATRPIRTVRGYALDPWTDGSHMVLCSSYSGDTEETLACFEGAEAAGSVRVALTTGGALAERAREAGVPVVGVPSGLLPRASVVYMMVGALETAAASGAGPSLRTEIDSAASLLTDLAGQWGPGAGADSEAKTLAKCLHETIPVVHGNGPTVAAARRWKGQLNENAKIAAFASELPEANHNEILGWEQGIKAGPFSAVFLEDPDQHPRVTQRVELTAAAVEAAGGKVARVSARGDNAVERTLSLVLLGDLVSVYLAALRGEDPSRMEAIDSLKAGLD